MDSSPIAKVIFLSILLSILSTCVGMLNITDRGLLKSIHI